VSAYLIDGVRTPGGRYAAALAQIRTDDLASLPTKPVKTIALGHPLRMARSRRVLSAARELQRRGGRYALCTMCVGLGQRPALILEGV